MSNLAYFFSASLPAEEYEPEYEYESEYDEYDIQKTISSLEAANWDVELAVSSFFENSDKRCLYDVCTPGEGHVARLCVPL